MRRPTCKDADFLRAFPDPDPDYVTAHLTLVQTRHTADSHRPENDVTKTQRLVAYRPAADWAPEALERLMTDLGGR